jgi:hypothetical protein
MRASHRRLVLSGCLIAAATGLVVRLAVRPPEPDVDQPTTKRTELIRRGVPASTAQAYSDQEVGLALKYIDTGLDPDVAALRAQLEALDAPESGACALVRSSMRAESDKQFANDVEKICVAWRKVMWDYAMAHAAEVETGDPAAIERTRTAFAMMDMALMRELVRAGGGDEAMEPMPAAPVEAKPTERESFQPELGRDVQEEP